MAFITPNMSSGIKAGLLIALLGPPIGAIGLWLYAMGSAFLEGKAPVEPLGGMIVFVFYSYVIAGLPAIFAGAYAGLRIASGGWISMLETAALSLVAGPALVIMMRLVGNEWSSYALTSFRDDVLGGLAFFTPLFLLSAFSLRYLLLKWKIVAKPA